MSTRSWVRPLSRTCAPSRASPWAIAKPIPAVEPVTRADFPARWRSIVVVPAILLFDHQFYFDVTARRGRVGTNLMRRFYQFLSGRGINARQMAMQLRV